MKPGDTVTWRGITGRIVATVPPGSRPYLGPPSKDFEHMRRAARPSRPEISYLVYANGRLYWPQEIIT